MPDTEYVRLDKPVPPGITVTPDGGWQWTAERSVFRCMPFFKIVHIVCTVFAALVFILIAAVEAGEPFGAVVVHGLIGAAVVAVIDLLICLLYGAKRAFLFKAVFRIERDSVSAVEQEVTGRNILTVIVQLIAGLLTHGDTSYGFNAGYNTIRAIVPAADKTMIKIKAGGRGGILLTDPEQFDFVMNELKIRTERTGK